jgi:hypothetical protein
MTDERDERNGGNGTGRPMNPLLMSFRITSLERDLHQHAETHVSTDRFDNLTEKVNALEERLKWFGRQLLILGLGLVGSLLMLAATLILTRAFGGT